MTPSRERPARGILDTSAVVAMHGITDPSALPAEPLITAITLAELSAGPLVARDERERAARQAHLQEAEADFDPLPFDRASARAFGQVAACSQARRRAHSPSGMIRPISSAIGMNWSGDTRPRVG